MAGYPLLPVYSLAFADESACQWRWLRRKATAGKNGGATKGGGPTAGIAEPPGPEWEETGCRSACYTPAAADEGCVLRVECRPGRLGGGSSGSSGGSSGPDATGDPLAAETGPVRPGPRLPAAASRQLAPPAPAVAPAFRVMSYNILADQYAGTAYAQKVLFDYCPTPLLDNNYRRQLVLEEVLAYQVGRLVVWLGRLFNCR
jgi:2',5'-phosphodiesterase